jgi:hypothetical protein
MQIEGFYVWDISSVRRVWWDGMLRLGMLGTQESKKRDLWRKSRIGVKKGVAGDR